MPYVFAECSCLEEENPNTFSWSNENVNLGLDGNFNLTGDEIGKQGELFVKGRPTMAGYLSLESGWPFEIDKNRIVKTGDLFRIIDKGKLLFIGRKDRQVKIDGYRVDLDMISEWIEKLSYVKSCYTIVEPEKGQIHAVIELKSPSLSADREKQIIEYCKQGLVFYMIPCKIHIVNSIPRTRTGKVSYKKLIDSLIRNPVKNEEN